MVEEKELDGALVIEQEPEIGDSGTVTTAGLALSGEGTNGKAPLEAKGVKGVPGVDAAEEVPGVPWTAFSSFLLSSEA